MSIVRKSSVWAAVPALCLLNATGAFADNGIGGDETVNNRIVNSNAVWTVLVAEPFALVKDAGVGAVVNPEPGTLLLIGAGLGAMAFRRRRQARKNQGL